MNNCDKLITVISSLLERDSFDYLIAIGPIILSLIAIFISIYTSAKQNRIALFDKRCCVLETIKRIIWLSENIVSPENLYAGDVKQHGEQIALAWKSKRICTAYNSMFGTNLDYQKKSQEIPAIYASIYIVEKDLMMAEFLFCTQIDNLLFEMSKAMAKYMADTISQVNNSTSKKEFCKKCSEFDKNWLAKLEKETQLAFIKR